MARALFIKYIKRTPNFRAAPKKWAIQLRIDMLRKIE